MHVISDPSNVQSTSSHHHESESRWTWRNFQFKCSTNGTRIYCHDLSFGSASILFVRCPIVTSVENQSRQTNGWRNLLANPQKHHLSCKHRRFKQDMQHSRCCPTWYKEQSRYHFTRRPLVNLDNQCNTCWTMIRPASPPPEFCTQHAAWRTSHKQISCSLAVICARVRWGCSMYGIYHFHRAWEGNPEIMKAESQLWRTGRDDQQETISKLSSGHEPGCTQMSWQCFAWTSRNRGVCWLMPILPHESDLKESKLKRHCNLPERGMLGKLNKCSAR